MPKNVDRSHYFINKEELTLDRSHSETVERGVQVYTAQSITLPVLINGENHGIAIYIVELGNADRQPSKAKERLLAIAKHLDLSYSGNN
jgi:hypothetical protein